MKRIVTLMALCAAFCAASAQDYPSDFGRLTLESARQQFDATNNAAGMGLSQPANGSKTQIETFYTAGDFHLAQQGPKDYGFEFSTLRYDRFSDKLFMKGSFFYSFDREKERKWSDVRDPWFSIPFIYGSAVAKDYDTHNSGLTFDLYTAPLADWISVGVRTTYEVADISGMRDPRPRTGYLDLQVVPSVLFTLGRHHIGLDAGYGYSKEKLIGLSTIQSYPNLYYYKMTGLDHIDGAIAAYSGFKRQFVGDRYLGDISYGYTSDGFSAMVSAGAEYMNQNAYGDKMQSPGSYNYIKYNAVADLLIGGGATLHKLHLKGTYNDAGSNEYLQELTAEKDPETGATTETWVTLYEYVNRYMLKQYDAALDYTLFGGCTGTDYKWSVRAGAGYTAFVKECYLPYSAFNSSAVTATLGGSLRLMERNAHKLDISLDASGYMPIEVSQSLQFSNIYTEEVLVPDLAYYSSKRVGASCDITWTFPMNLGKAGMANGYLRLSGSICKALPEGMLSGANLTLGLFTF